MSINTTNRAILAEEAMETLFALRRHAQDCRQCRTDVNFCDTNVTYTRNFEKVFDNWIRLRPGSQ